MDTPLTPDQNLDTFSPERRAAVLVETLPYIQRFRGSVIVVKLGGNAMVDDDLAARFAEDIGLMHSVGGCESGFAIPDPVENDIVWSGCYDGILERYDLRTSMIFFGWWIVI